MNTEQAIKILEQALNASAKAGVFNLQDSATINVAIQVIKKEYSDTLVTYGESEDKESIPVKDKK